MFELKHIVVVWYMYRYTVLLDLVLDLVRTAVLVLVGVIEVYMYR